MVLCVAFIAFPFQVKLSLHRVLNQKKKKQLKFVKKPQFVAEFIQKDKRALHKTSSNLLKMRSFFGV
ncbi:hypothetical protein HpNP74_21580 [Helicobacter pylori]